MIDIRIDFGHRIKELRNRVGMSQELLAHLAELDRSYISSIESGQRNISIVNIAKIAKALKITIPYLFSNERFCITPAYQQQDSRIPFVDRFMYYLDYEKNVLAFQVTGLFSSYKDFDYLASTILGICLRYGKRNLNIMADYRYMLSADGQPAAYSPEVMERGVVFQQKLLKYCNKAVVLCNSEYMVQQLNYISKESGMSPLHLYGVDEEIVAKAFNYLGIYENNIVQVNNYLPCMRNVSM